MKALGYRRAHALADFSIELLDAPAPQVEPTDLLVAVKAVGISPGDALMRQLRSSERDEPVILGFEFAGTVVGIGSAVSGFTIGDHVFGIGDHRRQGAWAERIAVDHRIVSRMPNELDFVDAASFPIGGVTAWEAIFRDSDTLPSRVDTVLVTGGSGAVGALAIQLLKARSAAKVICTVADQTGRDWAERSNADLLLDRNDDVPAQLRAAGLGHVDMIVSTGGGATNLPWIVEVLRPFGHLSVVDIQSAFNFGPIAGKSITLHTEMVFASIVNGGKDAARRGAVLREIAGLIETKLLRPIVETRLRGLSAETMRRAHEAVEQRASAGKVVIEF